MEKLNELCADLENHLDEIAKNFKEEEFPFFCFKDLQPNFVLLPNKEFFDYLPNVKGLYIFEIKRDVINYKYWFQKFEINFHEYEDDAFYWRYKFTPRVNKLPKNFKDKEDLEWIPFYVGKSQNIKKRIHEHIFSDLGRSPFSLKLFSRFSKGVFINDEFRLKIIKFDNLENKHYNLVASYLEKKIRERLKPIVGKQ